MFDNSRDNRKAQRTTNHPLNEIHMKRPSSVLAILILSLPFSAQKWTEFAVGPNYTYPAAINNSGLVTGSYSAFNTNGSKAFIRNADGTLIRIQSNALYSGGASVNSSGDVVGYAGKSWFHRLPDGTFQRVSLYCCATSALSVNGAGYIAGTFFLNWQRKIRALYLMDATGKYVQFTFPHDKYPHDSVSIEVGGLNNSNQIAGSWTAYRNGVFGCHGFLYDAGKITQLDVTGAVVTQPRALNDNGEIAGLDRLRRRDTWLSLDRGAGLHTIRRTASHVDQHYGR